MANSETTRLSVLIDAGNASANVMTESLDEVARYGAAAVQRAYRD